MTKKILVIEDELKHTRDAQTFFATQPDVDVIYASNYSQASELICAPSCLVVDGVVREFDSACSTRGILNFVKKTGKDIKGNIDGVISDIYFPLTFHHQWNQPEPIGVRVAIELSQLGIPFVLNTAGYHHGRKYEWINQLTMDQDWPIVDGAGENYELDASSKRWKKAYEVLKKKM